MAPRRKIRFFIRVILYITVVVLLYQNRDGFSWRNLTQSFNSTAHNDTTLIIAGRDLAPGLVDRLITAYHRDYPDLTISVTGGGTNQALEDLLNGKASTAFLYRSPTPDEQDLFLSADGDSAIVAPIALGTVFLVSGDSTNIGPLTIEAFQGLLTGQLGEYCERFYVPDPNEGLWDSIRYEQGLTDTLSAVGPAVVYLTNADAVIEAVRNDNRAWGMVSSLNTPFTPESNLPPDVYLISVQGDADAAPAYPTYENVATGVYPLYHRLYVVCRENGDRQGGKFLTHLSSARGLRQVERAGIVPAKQVLREVYLTTKPLGE